ncbi:hypothetical protein NSK_005365 [Nannochloropsis salina CCMP1776]|uniref:RRM domain-containing protein n=1 Tax=Nannochloropsis salina CCMP1776 TaxID=1027361 RepID=A0A4D9CVH7_9STRA|nr:hypothetical protein NSK_005365 [Nannochloropsis salina CCMP1776]|eukprot:TFJ83301.1 hypothetical protein NSK_005365 [Nannochloropsis salina CCMP1776]
MALFPTCLPLDPPAPGGSGKEDHRTSIVAQGHPLCIRGEFQPLLARLVALALTVVPSPACIWEHPGPSPLLRPPLRPPPGPAPPLPGPPAEHTPDFSYQHLYQQHKLQLPAHEGFVGPTLSSGSGTLGGGKEVMRQEGVHMSSRKKAANKIFVGGLHWETTDDKLRKHFMLFGEVIDAVVMKDPISRRSRGFGFITFAEAGAVDRVLAQDNHILDSRRVEAKRAVPRSETLMKEGGREGGREGGQPPTPPMRPLMFAGRSGGEGGGYSHANALGGGGAANDYSSSLPPSYPLPSSYPSQPSTTPSVPPSSSSSSSYASHGPHSASGPGTHKIFVGGLHYDTKDSDFRHYFSLFGRVLSAEVMFNRETHKSRGFGFVVFEDDSSVESCLSLPQHLIDGKLVEVKRAIPRNQVGSPSLPPSLPSSFSGPMGATSGGGAGEEGA